MKGKNKQLNFRKRMSMKYFLFIRARMRKAKDDPISEADAYSHRLLVHVTRVSMGAKRQPHTPTLPLHYSHLHFHPPSLNHITSPKMSFYLCLFGEFSNSFLG